MSERYIRTVQMYTHFLCAIKNYTHCRDQCRRGTSGRCRCARPPPHCRSSAAPVRAECRAACGMSGGWGQPSGLPNRSSSSSSSSSSSIIVVVVAERIAKSLCTAPAAVHQHLPGAAGGVVVCVVLLPSEVTRHLGRLWGEGGGEREAGRGRGARGLRSRWPAVRWSA